MTDKKVDFLELENEQFRQAREWSAAIALTCVISIILAREALAAPAHATDLASMTSARHRCRAKSGSRPISRVLSWAAIPLGPASPQGSSIQPGSDAGHVIAPLFGLAPGGVCRAGLLPDSRCALTAPFHPCLILLRGHRRFTLCCTFRRLAPPRRYLAPCPVEPGLSSARKA